MESITFTINHLCRSRFFLPFSLSSTASLSTIPTSLPPLLLNVTKFLLLNKCTRRSSKKKSSSAVLLSLLLLFLLLLYNGIHAFRTHENSIP